MKNSRFTSLLLLGFSTAVLVLFADCSRTNSAYISPLGEIPNPSDNELNEAKIALGKEFFFDKRLSLDQSISCATCHKPGLAFTDGLVVSDGILGRKSSRNSPTLLNAAFLDKIMFDAEIPTLEMQAIVPIQDHNEMGMNLEELMKRLKAVPEYEEAARKIFNREMDIWVLTRSLAAYQRSLLSDNSPFDKFYYQQKKYALSASEKRGWLIFSEKLYCTSCHPAPYFTTNKPENNGLYENYGTDQGRFRVTHDTVDMGKFKVPSLRNIEITDPYMHDGSIADLEEVLEHYMRGGKNHPNKSSIIKPFTLTKREKEDLLNFLYALTDMSFMERL
jgi:cytochrome c peroxidase